MPGNTFFPTHYLKRQLQITTTPHRTPLPCTTPSPNMSAPNIDHIDQGSPNSDSGPVHVAAHDGSANDDSGPARVAAQHPSGNSGLVVAHSHTSHAPLSDASDYRPSDFVFFSTPRMVISDKTGWLQSLLEQCDNPQHRKNLEATIELVRSGAVITSYQVVADGKLMNSEDWRPLMGPFFSPTIVNAPLLALASYPHTPTNNNS